MTVLFIIACVICAILFALLVGEMKKNYTINTSLGDVKRELDETIERLTEAKESLISSEAENDKLSSGFSRVVAHEYVKDDDVAHVFDGDMQKQIHKRLASKIGYAVLRAYPDKVITDNNGLPVYSVAFYVKPASTEE